MVVDKIVVTNDPKYVPSKEMTSEGVPGGLGSEESKKK